MTYLGNKDLFREMQSKAKGEYLEHEGEVDDERARVRARDRAWMRFFRESQTVVRARLGTRIDRTAKWHVSANKKRRSKSIEIQKMKFFSKKLSFFSQPRRSIERNRNAPARIFLRLPGHMTFRASRYYARLVSVHACHAPPLRAFDDLPPLAHDHQRAHHRPLVDAQTREVLREVPLTRCRADGELLLDLRLH